MKHSKTKDSVPFQRFEDLTKRLLSISKEEADAKAAEQKQRKNTKSR